MSGVEHAAGDRGLERSSPFPSEWGTPPTHARALAAWVKINVVEHEIRKGRRTSPAQAQLRLLALRDELR